MTADTMIAPPNKPPLAHTVASWSWRNWQSVLVACGTTLSTATKWEGAFREQVAPDTFGDDELAHFLGQCLHETGMFLRLQEDLAYRAERMMEVWPHRFPTIESTAGLVMNPRALAEKVYGGRMGNDSPGDGFKYRGRGFPMVTGRDSYEALQIETGEPLVDLPELLLTPHIALKCGLVWWKNNVSDTMVGHMPVTVETVTQIVNNGQTGIKERRQITAAARRALLANPWK